MNIIEGNLVSKEDTRIGIVISRFNEFITSKLLDGSLDGLKRLGVDEDMVDIMWVPGAFEIPLAAKKIAQTEKYDAIITLGAIIRGATSHYDLVCNQVASGVNQVGLDTGVPTIFGVITTENIEQAIERSGTKAGNLGFDYAQSAIELVNLFKQIH